MLRLRWVALALVAGCAGVAPVDPGEDGNSPGARRDAAAARDAAGDDGPGWLPDAALRRDGGRPDAAGRPDAPPRDGAPPPDARPAADGPPPDAPRPPDAPPPPDAPRPPDAPPARCNLGMAFGVPVALAALNSAQDDTTPSFSPDGLTLYFSSTRPDGAGLFDIYRASRPTADSSFGPPQRVAELSSSGHDYGVALTPDGLVAFFTSERTGTGIPLGGNLWMATRAGAGEPFGAATVVAALSTDGAESDPALGAGGTQLVFASNRAGSAGIDLWMASYDPAARSFGPPALLAGVGSAQNEFGPSMTSDGLTLAFTSNRGGTYDLYLTTRASASGAFDAPAPLRDLNSTAADKSPALSPDGCEIVFASRRGGTSDDLYYARRP